MVDALLEDVRRVCSSPNTFTGTPVVSDLRRRLVEQHIKTLADCMRFRQLRAGCYGDAKDRAGEKGVSDSLLEKVMVEKYGLAAVEEYKNNCVLLPSLEFYVRFLVDFPNL